MLSVFDSEIKLVGKERCEL